MSGINLGASPHAALPTTLATPRLVLQMPASEHVAPLNEAILESFAELHAWMEWAIVPPNEDDTRAFCEEALRQRREGSSCPLLMLDGRDGSIIGATGYARIDWAVPAFEIGYWCRTPRCGHGYVTEATAALTRFAFETLGANRVQVRMDDRNQRSIAVPERLGFDLEGILRHDVRDHHDRLRDTRVYALLSLAGLREQRPVSP
jgi:RimJ/RimL family protein N-acetyltransferase